MDKSFAVESVQTFGEAGSGKFEAIVSVFGNVDAVKDVVMSTAFDRAVKEQDPPPVVWSHFWNIPPIGDVADWGPVEKGLAVKGELFVGADDKHQYADMVYAAMKSRDGRKPALREFSFSYDVPDGGAKMTERTNDDGSAFKVQELHEVFPVHEVGPCLRGCNDRTELITAPKAASKLEIERLLKAGIIAKEELCVLLHDEMRDDDGEKLQARCPICGSYLRGAVRTQSYPREYAEL